MADSLKFGPEWLRTLNQSLAASAAASSACTPPSSEGSSGGGGGHGPSTTTAGVGAGPTVPRPALTLARHRYGREEMLALFDPGLPPPPPSPAALAVLFVERAQPPLALVQMSDDETRVWNRGVNSDAVLRMSKSTGAGGPSGQPTSGPGGAGGRGGGLGSTGGPGGLRGQSRGLGIPGRGAGSGPGPGVLSGSAPFYRYDDSSAAGGDSGGDGIRGGGIGSLRPGRPFVRMQSSERSWSDRNGTDHEWGGGSGPGSSALGTSPRKDFGRGFDSWRRQGRNAVNSEQDDDPPASGGWRSSTTKWSGRTGGSSWRSDSEPNKDTGGWSVPRSNSNSWGDDHVSSRGPHPHVHRPWDPPPHAHSHPAAHGTDSDSVSGPLPEWATETPTESRGSFDASGAFHGGTPLSDDEDGSGGHGTARGQRHSALTGDLSKRAGSPLTQRDTVPPGVTRSASQNGVGDPAERHVRPMQEVTKSASTGSDSPSRSVTSRNTDRSGVTEEVESRRTATEKQTPPPPPAPTLAPSDRDRERERSASRPDEEMDRMREVADDLVAKLMEDEDHRTGVPPPTSVPPGSDKWFYRDPQGDVQGPFSSSEMLDWFRSGYFNLTLLVRRACDERYSSLGDIIKLWGRLPFTPGGPPVPPIKADAIPPVSSVSVPPLVPAAPPPTSDILSDSHGHNLLMQQYQYQYTMLQRQLLLGQQAAVHAAAQAAIGELSQSDRWATLSPIEQRRLVTERLALQQMLGVPPLVPPVSVPPPSIVDLFSVAAAQQQPGPQPAQQPPPPPPSAQPQPVSATNPVAQLISQMQMAAAVAPKEHQPPPPAPHTLVDPLQQLIQQMSGGLPTVSSAPTVPPPGGQPLGGGVGLDSDGPGRTLLQTLNAGKPPSMPPVDSVWGGSVPAGYSLGVGTAAPWMNAAVTTPPPPVSSTPSVPPGQLPSLPLSLWDLAQQQGKDVKTEHQVLEEQLRAEEERRLEEQRKREENEEAMRKQKELLEKEEEEKRKLKEKEEEEKKKKKRQEEEEEKKKRKQQEEEDKKKKKQQEEEEKRRKKQQEEEEKKRKKQQEEEEKRKKKEEERRLREQEEEEKRRKKEQEEAERQLKEEEEREKKKKQQEAKKIEEAMKKEKEKAAQKREEEKKRKEAEKEKKKKAEEAKKKEEEEKKKQEEEEKARQRRQEQQEKALRKLQEQQEKARQAAALRPAPWTTTPAPPTAAVQQPLTEIQRQERERERQLQLQQLQQQQQQQQLQQQQQNANAAAQNSAGAQAGNGSSVIGGLQLRWAEVKPPAPAAKSLTEIQQEEQENLAKQQLERERLQQQQQQQQAAVAPAVATASIWGSASQSLSWAASVSASSPWGNTGIGANSTSSGFWEDAAKTSAAVPISKSRSATNHNNNIINNSSSGNNKNSGGMTNSTQPWKNLPVNTKTRSKKEEAVVMKLFEPRPDEFTQWCTDALGSLKHSIDVPTFVAFLRDIESAYEVKDYVRVYLGEGRDAQEFSRQFLERRSKLQQQKAARDRTPEDDLSTPAPAITPSQDFHEVKGKGKKAKKSRMYKVDSRILGFSVTAAQDRLNVGERDFGDGM